MSTESAAPAPQSGSGSASERLRKQQQYLKARERERRKKAEDRAEAEREDARREANCRRARDMLFRYTHATGIYRTDQEGNRTFLSHEERAAAEAKARRAVEKWCD